MSGLPLLTHNALFVVVWTLILLDVADALHHAGRRGRITTALAELHHWMLPFTWVLWIAWALLNAGLGNPISAALAILVAYMKYREWKKNDDDRWKKVRSKISAKVAVTGSGRLAVVPT